MKDSILYALKSLVRSLLKIIERVKLFIFLFPFRKKGKNIKLFFPLKMEGKQFISIGNNTSIGSFCHMWGGGVIEIGNNVLIAAHCCITSVGHDPSCSDMIKNFVTKKVVIEDDVWLGYNVIVLPGVTIGKGSVVGAGSVVTTDIPPFSIAVGNPVKVIKERVIIGK